MEIKAFVPAKDFELSKRFYQDLGFTLVSSDDDIAYLHCSHCSFLLQRYYVKEFPDNLMMHLLVEDVDAWHAHVQARNIAQNYQIKVTEPEQQPWCMRDFILIDPSGVL